MSKMLEQINGISKVGTARQISRRISDLHQLRWLKSRWALELKCGMCHAYVKHMQKITTLSSLPQRRKRPNRTYPNRPWWATCLTGEALRFVTWEKVFVFSWTWRKKSWKGGLSLSVRVKWRIRSRKLTPPKNGGKRISCTDPSPSGHSKKMNF